MGCRASGVFLANGTVGSVVDCVVVEFVVSSVVVVVFLIVAMAVLCRMRFVVAVVVVVVIVVASVAASIAFVVDVVFVLAIDRSCWKRCRKMPMSAMSTMAERMSMTAAGRRPVPSFPRFVV